MSLLKAKVEVKRAATADQNEAEKAILDRIARATVKGESLRQQVETQARGEAGEGGTPVSPTELEEQLAQVEAQIEELGKEFEAQVKKRVVTLVVTEGNRIHRFEQQRLIAQVDDWYRQQFVDKWRREHQEFADDPDRPTSEDLEGTSTRVDSSVISRYLAYTQYAAIAATLVPEECDNFDIPADLFGWGQVPDVITEPAIVAVYRLNPNWRPDWGLEPEEDDLKNAAAPS